MIQQNILLVGCGKMGSALMEGLLKKVSDSSQVLILTPNAQAGDKYGVRTITDISDIPTDYMLQTVLFAVKPQVIDSVLPQFAKVCHKNTLFASVAAGKKLSFYENILGEDKAIIRAMPNLPATIGQGITVLCANKKVNSNNKKLAGELFASVGETIWTEDETIMDAVTAISGSGPAYLFYFLECFSEAAKKIGLPEDMAVKLAAQTIKGSAALAASSDKTAAELRQQVTSPQGTTASGLEKLMSKDILQNLLDETVKAACERSKQLAD